MHTKGPWYVLRDADGDSSIFQKQNHQDLLIAVTSYVGRDEDDANAALIAAAPELLGALQEIVDRADQSNGGKGAQLPIVLHIREVAIAAIRKAKGGDEVVVLGERRYYPER